MTMPVQKPGRSEQTVCTPAVLLEAVRRRLAIDDFWWDLAATAENAVTGTFYSPEDNALLQPWPRAFGGWLWCNPPYSDLSPWVQKAWEERSRGVQSALLVPASPGSNWWREWVHGKAYVTYLNGRVTFVGHTGPYPKDLALLLYAPYLEGGECVWRWK